MGERLEMEEGEDMLDGEVAVVEVEILDGRLAAERPTTSARVAVQQVEGEKNLMMIQLTSSHYAFSLKRSNVIRSVDSFYQLSSLLVSPQFLSSRALHLFLQTSHSVPRILENIE